MEISDVYTGLRLSQLSIKTRIETKTISGETK